MLQRVCVLLAPRGHQLQLESTDDGNADRQLFTEEKSPTMTDAARASKTGIGTLAYIAGRCTRCLLKRTYNNNI